MTVNNFRFGDHAAETLRERYQITPKQFRQLLTQPRKITHVINQTYKMEVGNEKFYFIYRPSKRYSIRTFLTEDMVKKDMVNPKFYFNWIKWTLRGFLGIKQ